MFAIAITENPNAKPPPPSLFIESLTAPGVGDRITLADGRRVVVVRHEWLQKGKELIPVVVVSPS